MDILAARLKKLREENKVSNKDWTQGYVADKLNVARTSYTAYENGTKQPTLETLINIADLFDVSIDYLLGRSVQKNINDDFVKELIELIQMIPEENINESKIKLLAYTHGLVDAYDSN
ncbi:helix-turn-helix transcriptional regulator [Lysinibacillus sp. 1 U-2021]|uniref:helix-turn-helix domain-containing protein n=1 Tax=Lysinibacillus sp. 1 U-2021 TaxID=3039426 RepID=UPI002481902B|nr:helix-turn-helix transcriptional regulator [Lysinibacillus sp. 1 U-2021]WGT37945.1 helix-turn-helix transcriptional regulator [Lysinibacillus sp. 1 U-2021]